MSEIIPLADRWKQFAAEYCVDFIVTRAAQRANVPIATAYLMMQDERLIALIKDYRHKASERVAISVDNTLEQLRMIANSDVIDVLEALAAAQGESLIDKLREIPDASKFAIKSIKYTKNGPEIVMHDKLKAIELIGKYLGIFNDKIDLTVKQAGTLDMITSDMSPKEAADAYLRMLTDETGK